MELVPLNEVELKVMIADQQITIKQLMIKLEQVQRNLDVAITTIEELQTGKHNGKLGINKS